MLVYGSSLPQALAANTQVFWKFCQICALRQPLTSQSITNMNRLQRLASVIYQPFCPCLPITERHGVQGSLFCHLGLPRQRVG